MLTQDEKRLQLLLKFWSFLFAVGCVMFAFAPHFVIENLNRIFLKIAPTLPSLPYSEERFWLALTVSLMATISALCYSAQSDLKRKKDLVVFVLISKATSSLFFFLFFFLDRHSLAYLFGMALDGSIFVITFIFYMRATRSSQLIL
jgi:tryptophan-rich sensory protein